MGTGRVIPPGYVVATATKYPLGDFHEIEQKIAELEAKLRDMRFNPDRYVDNENNLVREKQEILENSGEKMGKEHSRRLKQIRTELQQEIQQEIEDVEQELSQVKAQKEAMQPLMRRDFPYFLFSA